jgi:hypothetical protein
MARPCFSREFSKGGNPVDFTANTVYTLSIYIGDRNDAAFTGYTFGLFVTNSTPLVQESDVATPADGTWVQRTLTYTATASDPNLGQQLMVRFGNTSSGGQTVFDAITLDASPVPDTEQLGIATCGHNSNACFDPAKSSLVTNVQRRALGSQRPQVGS